MLAPATTQTTTKTKSNSLCVFVRGRERGKGRGSRDTPWTPARRWNVPRIRLVNAHFVVFSLPLTHSHTRACSVSLSRSCTPHWPQCDLFISFNRIKILLSNSNGFKSCNVLRYQLNPLSTHEYSLHSLALSHSASPYLASPCLALPCLGFVWVVWLGPNIAGTNLIVVL